jgi:hypothetical protein
VAELKIADGGMTTAEDAEGFSTADGKRWAQMGFLTADGKGWARMGRAEDRGRVFL